MNRFTSKDEANRYFERIAAELDEIAAGVDPRRKEDSELAERLAEFARQIRRDSGLKEIPAPKPARRKAVG